jgi:hypothetical protein
MALRQNRPIRRVSDSALTPEDKLRINKKAKEQWEEEVFPFEKDEKGIFSELSKNLQVSEEPKSKLRFKIQRNMGNMFTYVKYEIAESNKSIKYRDEYVIDWTQRWHRFTDLQIETKWGRLAYNLFLQDFLNRLDLLKKKLYSNNRDDTVDDDIMRYAQSRNKNTFLKSEFEEIKSNISLEQLSWSIDK